MINNRGWDKHSTWDHAESVTDLYRRRATGAAEEMTCHAQAVSILKPHLAAQDSVLDVGCGSAYLYRSFHSRHLPVQYWGIDPTCKFIDIGRAALASLGLSSGRLQPWRIEDVDGTADHVVSVNVLTYLENYHRPLERMLNMARKTVLLRESISETASCLYVKDKYLDPGADLSTYIHTFSKAELRKFVEERGFECEFFVDEFSKGLPQNVIDYPHYWTFLLAKRK